MGYAAKNPIIANRFLSQQNTREAYKPNNSPIVRIESRNSVTIHNVTAAWLIAKLATI
jgi:hypothetical protein